MKIVLLNKGEYLHDSDKLKLNLIAVTDKKIDIYDDLVINGEHYIPSQIAHNDGIVGVRKFIPLNEDEKLYENNLTCPYCGYEDVDAFELQDDSGITECGRCGAELEYEREYEITYNTKLIKKPRRVEIFGEGSDENVSEEN